MAKRRPARTSAMPAIHNKPVRNFRLSNAASPFSGLLHLGIDYTINQKLYNSPTANIILTDGSGLICTARFSVRWIGCELGNIVGDR